MTWHFTITDISKTWVKENIDNIVADYLRRWLGIPVSGTLDICMLSRDKLGLNIIEPSTKFTQCQYIIRNALKTSTSSDTKAIHALTSIGSKLQYDRLRSTKGVVKEKREEKGT